MVAIKLSKSGYGKITEILNERLDRILTLIEYEKFIPEYEERFIEINKTE